MINLDNKIAEARAKVEEWEEERFHCCENNNSVGWKAACVAAEYYSGRLSAFEHVKQLLEIEVLDEKS